VEEEGIDLLAVFSGERKEGRGREEFADLDRRFCGCWRITKKKLVVASLSAKGRRGGGEGSFLARATSFSDISNYFK